MWLRKLTFQSPALEKIARAAYDIEEATSMAFDLILEHKVWTFAAFLS